MTLRTDQLFSGLVIYGFPDPANATADTAGVIFTNGYFSLPASLSTLKIQAWIPEEDGVSDISVSADPRTPLGASGDIEVKLIDTDGLLSKLLIFDPFASPWDMEQAELTPAASSVRINTLGGSPPAVGQDFWIEGEAFVVTGRAQISNAVWSLNFNRAQCASFAASHRVLPNTYWVSGGESGEERLPVRSKPHLMRDRFLATVYRFRETNGQAEIVRAVHGFISGQPVQREGGVFSLIVAPLHKLAADKIFGPNRGPVTLSRCLEVITEGPVTLSGVDLSDPGAHSPATPGAVFPTTGPIMIEGAAWMTGEEAAQVFNEPAFEPGAGGAVSATADTWAPNVSPASEKTYYLGVEAGGYKYTYRVTSAVRSTRTSTNHPTQGPSTESYLRVGLRLAAAEPGATIRAGVSVDPSTGGSTADVTQRFNNGFAGSGGLPVKPGESPPKVDFRVIFRTTLVKFFLFTMVSDGQDSASANDKTIGRLGLGLPESLGAPGPLLNIGTPAADPSTIPKTTAELAKLDQLNDRIWTIPIKMGDKFADVMNSLLDLHLLLATPLSSGPFTLRHWATPRPAPVALNPEQTEIDQATTLDPLRALQFQPGIDFLTFEPRGKPQFVTLRGSQISDFAQARKIRVYQPEADALTSGYMPALLAECARGHLKQLGGEPYLLPVRTSILDGARETTDGVTLTDELVATEAGLGVVGKAYWVTGVSLDEEGHQELLVMPDNLNAAGLVTAGKIAPTLLVVEVISKSLAAGTYTIKVRVSSIGDDTFDATTSHLGIWQAIANTANAKVRVIRPGKHNPVIDPAKDRTGWAELYAGLPQVEFRAYAQESVLTLTISNTWEQGGFTVDDFVVAGESYITLPDRRTNDVLGVFIDPIPAQGYNAGAGDDFLTFNSPSAPHQSAIT